MEGLPFEYDVAALITAILEGYISTDNLPRGLYLKIAEHLNKGVDEGLGDIVRSNYAPDKLLQAEMRNNIYMFSGAKTYQQVRDMSMILAGGADIATFKQVREAATKVFKTYNVTYLQTEYDTAIGMAQNARKWNDFERDKANFDLLEYDAVMDSNTSDICRPLDGIRLPVDHPFWNTHSPLNHFNCRCFLRKVIDKMPTNEKKVQAVSEKVTPKMQDVFKMNPGKDKIVFSEKHPYFDVAPKDKERQKDNFGLPKPPKP